MMKRNFFMLMVGVNEPLERGIWLSVVATQNLFRPFLNLPQLYHKVDEKSIKRKA
jgi:hypothetical protein